MTFEAIEERGVEGFLERIRDEPTRRLYEPQRARKREMPKDGGKKVRVLSIPCIRDRVFQGALKLIMEPIFEADFQEGSYGDHATAKACGNGAMVHQVRNRWPKGAATVEMTLPSPRHIPTRLIYIVLADLMEHGLHPQYISPEWHLIGVFCALVSMGYEQFKLIEGVPVSQKFSNNPMQTRDGPLIRHVFPGRSAGPFGEDVPGAWLGRIDCWQRLMAPSTGWIDIHARA